MTSSTSHITGTERIAELNDELYDLNDDYGRALMTEARGNSQVLAEHLLSRSQSILVDFAREYHALLKVAADPALQDQRGEIMQNLRTWFGAFRACKEAGHYDDDLGIKARSIILKAL